jgi:hypothetical protein
MNSPYFENQAGIGQATTSLIAGFAAFYALSTDRQDAVGGMFWFNAEEVWARGGSRFFWPKRTKIRNQARRSTPTYSQTGETLSAKLFTIWGSLTLQS